MRKVFLSIILASAVFTFAAESSGLLGARWVLLGAGAEFYGNDNSNPVVGTSLNVPLVTDVDFRADFDLHFRENGTSFWAFPGAVVSMKSLLKNPGGVNPYARAGILVVSDEGRKQDELGWHLGIGAGAEIPIGPSVFIDPHLMTYIVDASSVLLGLTGGYWINSSLLVGLGVEWNGDEYYRAQGNIGLRF